MTGLKYFPPHELWCKHCKMIRLHPTFAVELPKLREAWGKPLTPNSVCRCKEHNDRSAKLGGAGGHPRSLHVCDKPHHPTQGCMSADIRWRGWLMADQIAFARLAWRMGWAVGLHDGFCHIDRRGDLKLPSLPRAVFLYGTWTGRWGPEVVTS